MREELEVSSPKHCQVVRKGPEGLGFSLLTQAGHVRPGGDSRDVRTAFVSSQRHCGPSGGAEAGVQAVKVQAGFVQDVDGIEDVGH